MKKRIIRNSAGFILAASLILLGYLKRAKKRALEQGVITSIAFHNPDKDMFSKITAWLQSNGFIFLSLTQLINILDKKVPCPRGAVWISLDDGWRNNLTAVIPPAVKRRIPITIFICTGAVEEGTFWWKKITQHPEMVPPQFGDVNKLKKQPEDIRRRIIRNIDEASVPLPREAMTVAEVKDISAIVEIDLGAHTDTHPILPNCTEKQLETELADSKRKLEEWTGKKITAFAYPNGSFDGREKPFLEKLGYIFAATTEERPAGTETDTLLFPRCIIMDDGSYAENLCHALGIWSPVINKIKQVIR